MNCIQVWIDNTGGKLAISGLQVGSEVVLMAKGYPGAIF